MNRNCVKSLAEAQAKAAQYLEAKDQVVPLVSQAARKAEANYDFLLASWESFQALLRMLRCWLNGSYRPPASTLLAALAAVIYLVEPFDLIPDGVPVFGLLDDAALIAAVAKMNLTEISRFRIWEASLKGDSPGE